MAKGYGPQKSGGKFSTLPTLLYQWIVRAPADIAVRLKKQATVRPLAETRDYGFYWQKQRSAVLWILQELGAA